MSMKRLILGGVLAGLLAASALGGYVAFLFFEPMSKPGATGEVRLFIPSGTTFYQVTQQLRKQQMLAHPRIYDWTARWLEAPRRIKAGEFVVSRDWTTFEVLGHLIRGKGIRHRVTFPEGLNFRQVAARLEAKGFGDAASYLALMKDPKLLNRTGVAEAKTLEGFLYPETYFFSRVERPRQILAAMISQYHRTITPEFRARAKELGLSEYEVLTLASIVEKETGMAEDRGKIAAVFHNRLRKRMLLGSDPTVIYGMPEFNGNLTRKHLRTPTPYNTYTRRGLPPTPICNPGKGALYSTLYPDDVSYLYFVARGDGTSVFSKTLKKHNQNVWYYQKVRKNRIRIRKEAEARRKAKQKKDS
ncbi:MAG: endolytic transglycosylase MltG [SAR324 cluster bacterium]|nr:endolytic transglycosylase MltG [SAR324 cluster bacterium]